MERYAREKPKKSLEGKSQSVLVARREGFGASEAIDRKLTAFQGDISRLAADIHQRNQIIQQHSKQIDVGFANVRMREPSAAACVSARRLTANAMVPGEVLYL